ncbi:voltage-dependent potassium channel, beta subunit [Conidiobolus coronatus NRRL 28638]|uniref:Voltage-dependent potassium channel, beta subunit n=1 Tax=Conidiobolus coronatus (strain ATCC 28846 / CBS 209.66 / NRRL 28638) TaxID=796925 RepID=A0A137NQH8_CONC2|nr:voltage-dependent potassium channel, beta subunit [Conidiobolus coronatus NRRL 28638]|eukprot:KXN64964.1 voltage-dependent potassium channel, beta subunit [Conidiobolus coronatus NRRL 28638]
MAQVSYRRLGKSGLKVSVLSLGVANWDKNTDQAKADELIKFAFEKGINFFDNAEGYGRGEAEIVFGNTIKNNNLKREDIVVSTKIFFGAGGWGPNATGLSKKHLIEGLNGSLKRLQLEYVDIVFAHRPDPEVPIEEIVRGFNFLINQGKAFYWGTSEWSSQQITEAHSVAQRLGLEGPVVEQPEYNLLNRDKLEKEYLPIFETYGLGTTIWSPLASGILTGKYNNGIPEGSRASGSDIWGKMVYDSLNSDEGRAKIEKVRKLVPIAEKFGSTLPQLAIAWSIKNPNVSTAILGASRLEQLENNLKALEFVDKLTPEVLQEIEEIVNNKP